MAAVAQRAEVRAPSRRRPLSRRLGAAGPLTYVFLILVALVSIFPLYWSLVVASHDNSAVSAYPPVLTPGGDPISPLILSAVMFLLFEGSLLIIRLFKR